ncbi:MAG: hypothetical protein IJZ54_01770 [Clostridia bacterium]|nr:hypothetical protein [Clostridia bacterium]
MTLKVVKPGKKRSPFLYIVLGAVVVVFLGVFVYTVSGIYSETAEKRSQLASLQHEIEIQEMKNAELEAVVYSDVEYLKYATKVARDNDYVKSGERVFINSSGD